MMGGSHGRKLMDQGDAGDLSKLPTEEDTRYLTSCRQMTKLALDHAVPITFAPPLGRLSIPLNGGRVESITVSPAPGEIESATGCVLRLHDEYFVVTAEHVLDKYEERLDDSEVLIWQVGDLPFDPLRHVAWRGSSKHRSKDIVFLRVSEQEAREACADRIRIVSASIGWPPRTPQEDEIVLVAGYPKRLREVDNGIIRPGPLSAMLKVTRSTGDGTFKCRYENAEVISFDKDALPLEDLRGNTGGVSGGPVFRIEDSSDPFVFVGVISQIGGGAVDDSDTFVIESVDGVPSTFLA